MTDLALVIKAGGTPEIAQAIVDGIKSNQPTESEYATIKAELNAMKQREAALGVRVIRDRDYYYCKAKEAEYYYGDNRPPCKPAAVVLGIVGLICETVNGVYKYLSAWNREA